MPNNQRGIAHIFIILIILLAGVATGLYLIKNPQILKSRAVSGPVSGPVGNGFNPPDKLASKCLDNNTRVKLSWSGTGGPGYDLRVDVDPDNEGWTGCFSPKGDFCVNRMGPTEHIFYITPGLKYKWWVHSLRSKPGGNGTEDSDPAFGEFTCGSTPPQIGIGTTPSNLQVQCLDAGQTVNLSWNPVTTSGIYYQLRINKDPLSTWSPNGGGTYQDLVPKIFSNSVSLSFLTNLKPDTKNTFSVQAVPDGKQSSDIGVYTNRSDEYAFICSSKGNLEQPKNIQVSCSNGDINLSWDKVSSESELKHHVRGKKSDDPSLVSGSDWTVGVNPSDIVSNGAGDDIRCDSSRCTYITSGINSGTYRLWLDSYNPKSGALSNDTYISGLLECK